MKKLAIALLLSALFCVQTNQAQLRVAIKGGAQLSSVPGDSSPGWDTINYQYESRLGYHFGILADLRLSSNSKFHLQSGMSFSNKGRKFSTSYDTTTSAVAGVNALQFVNYMEIPLNLVFKIKLGKKSSLMLGGGPYAAFLYNGRERKETVYTGGIVTATENKDLKVATSRGEYNNLDYGVNALFGFEFGRVILTANYSQGLNDFYVPSGTEGKFKHQVMGGTLGFYLTNPEKKAAKKKEKEKAIDEQIRKEKEKEQERINEARKNKAKGRDRDKDGVPDDLDECPGQKGDSTTKGCPDKDGDGVSDKDDKCPEFTGTARNNGCPPVDTDKDGVYDEEDKCPELAGVKKNNGCPAIDTDKDGVSDEEDKCPNQAGSAKYKGCPVPDTDKDGVNDDDDRCPTVKGKKSNNGCPEIRREIVKKVENAARRVQFNYKSTTLTSSSKIVLNEVVKILKDNSELNVFIEGYTSSDGNPNNHIRLSTARAESVRKYFISKGLDPNRLTAEGFGSANPLNSERTEFLRARNRRVELKLTNN